jgi:hypothetical protein
VECYKRICDTANISLPSLRSDVSRVVIVAPRSPGCVIQSEIKRRMTTQAVAPLLLPVPTVRCHRLCGTPVGLWRASTGPARSSLLCQSVALFSATPSAHALASQSTEHSSALPLIDFQRLHHCTVLIARFKERIAVFGTGHCIALSDGALRACVDDKGRTPFFSTHGRQF